MFKIKKEKKKDFLVFDIGSGRIKGLILEKEGGKNRVKRFASKSFERFGIFQTAVFEKDLLERTLSQVIGELKSGDKLLPKSILVGLSPEMLKGRTTTLSFKRSSPERIIEEEEEKIILDLVLDKSQRKVAKRFGEIYKIAPSEFQVLKKEVIETKISGYKVSSILGKKGKLFDFEILVIFTLKNYLKIFNLIKKSFIFKEAILVHEEVEGLISWLKNKKNFSGTFIDIGSRFTQFFLVKDGLLKWMGEFEEGGDIFTQVLSENLGNAKSGRPLKSPLICSGGAVANA